MIPGLVDPGLALPIYAGLALGVFLVCTGLFQLASRRESRGEARSRRMRMIERGAGTAEILAVLKPPAGGSRLARLPVVGGVPRSLRQAGLAIPPGRFVLLCLGLGLTVGLAAGMRLGPLAALGLGLGAGLVGPLAVLGRLRDRRLDRMTRLLPDALDLMARGLRVGHPLAVSIAAVARDMPDPVGTEFGLVADQIAFGDDLVDAIGELAARVGLEDVDYLAAAIAIQHGTGGDLAAIVDTLSKTIRARIALRRRISAISAEGRLTAYFLTAVPFLILGANLATNPGYYGGVRDDPLFWPMALAVAVLVTLNGLILRKLVDIAY